MKISYMSPNLSLYLDVLRILAVALIIIAHAQSLFGIALPLGNLRVDNEAFAFFIVASGFLNRFQASRPDYDRRVYVIEKSSRIYAAVFVCLLFCFLCDGVGRNANEALYDTLAKQGLFSPYSALGLVGYLTFTNDVWFRHVSIGTLTSFWALSYFVMFYVYYGVTAFTQKSKNFLLVIWIILVGPIVALYLVLWVLGAAAYDFILKYRNNMGGGLSLLTYAFSWVAFAVAVVLAGQNAHLPNAPGDRVDAFVMSYLYQLAIALIVALNLISFESLFGEGRGAFAGIRSVFRWMAGGALTLYLIYPSLLTTSRAVFAQSQGNILIAIFAVIVVFIIGFLLAELGERTRDPYKGFVGEVLR